jgi:hypothetical protein
MKHLALVTAFCALSCASLASAQRAVLAVCPLSDAQTRASIDAFAKIVPTLKGEPRCVNCHGGFDPVTAESHPDVVLPTENDRGTDCTVCHDNMVPRTSGQPSEWHLAPKFMSFVGKSDRELCEQVKADAEGPCSGGSCFPWPLAEKFIGHVTDDEGRDNFTGTAFAGTKGLSGVPPEPPTGVTHAGLISLAHAWAAATGGEWQGHKDCGCGPAHYALRLTASTEVRFDDVFFRSVMPPVDVPITFRDDGTFTGEASATLQGAGAGAGCTLQSGGAIKFSVTGKAVQTWREHYLEATISAASTVSTQGTARCPEGTFARQFSGTTGEPLTVRLEGNVGEVADVPLQSPAPEVRSVGRFEIVKLAD